MGRPDSQLWERLFSVRGSDPRPLQSQIRVAVVDAILGGVLPAGSAAPSSRELAKSLKVSRNTVILAYQQLVDDGYLVSRERSGFSVAANPPASLVQPQSQPAPPAITVPYQPAQWDQRFRVRSSAFRSIAKPSDWQSYPYPFLYGQFDPGLFPIADWRQCCRQALSIMELKDWAPDKIDEDDPLLVDQLRSRILPRRGIWAQPDEIMITLGAQQALYLLADLLFHRNSVVGIEDPGYPDMRNIAALRCDHVPLLPVDAEGLIPGREMAVCDYVYVTPSHQCPTTVTMPLDRRFELLAEGTRRGTVFIEDDYESETRLTTPPLPALKSLDTDGRVIYVGSLSKVLAPGLRLGFIVASPDLIREARALRRLMVRHPPFNNQRTTALFLSLGHYEALVGRLAQVFSERSRVLREALARHLPQFRVSDGSGGSSLWLEGPRGFNAQAAADRARAQGLLIEPGNVFFGRPDHGRPCFRLGYSSVPVERIEPGIALLARCVEEQLMAAGPSDRGNWT